MDQQQMEINRLTEKEKDNYIFPNFVASTMAKTSQKVQYESSMMGTFLLLVSVFMTTIYYVGFTASTWIVKGFIIFNAVAGFLLLSSMLVTTYQQYKQYIAAVALERMINGRVETQEKISGNKIKVVRYVSAVIEVIIIVGLSWLINFWWLCIVLLHPLFIVLTTRRYIKKQEDLKNV